MAPCFVIISLQDQFNKTELSIDTKGITTVIISNKPYIATFSGSKDAYFELLFRYKLRYRLHRGDLSQF